MILQHEEGSVQLSRVGFLGVRRFHHRHRCLELTRMPPPESHPSVESGVPPSISEYQPLQTCWFTFLKSLLGSKSTATISNSESTTLVSKITRKNAGPLSSKDTKAAAECCIETERDGGKGVWRSWRVGVVGIHSPSSPGDAGSRQTNGRAHQLFVLRNREREKVRTRKTKRKRDRSGRTERGEWMRKMGVVGWWLHKHRRGFNWRVMAVFASSSHAGLRVLHHISLPNVRTRLFGGAVAAPTSIVCRQQKVSSNSTHLWTTKECTLMKLSAYRIHSPLNQVPNSYGNEELRHS